MLVHSDLLLILCHHVLEVLEVLLIVVGEGLVIIELPVILDFQLDFLVIDELVIKLERLYPVVSYGLLLGDYNILEVADDLFLDLQVDLQLYILQLEHVVLDNHLEEVAITLELDLLGNVVTDLFCARHAFHQLQVSNFLGDDVLVC